MVSSDASVVSLGRRSQPSWFTTCPTRLFSDMDELVGADNANHIFVSCWLEVEWLSEAELMGKSKKMNNNRTSCPIGCCN